MAWPVKGCEWRGWQGGLEGRGWCCGRGGHYEQCGCEGTTGAVAGEGLRATWLVRSGVAGEGSARRFLGTCGCVFPSVLGTRRRGPNFVGSTQKIKKAHQLFLKNLTQ